MAANKNNSNKRKYTYPYRPFFWSLHHKSSISSAEKEESIEKIKVSKEDI